MKVTVCFGGIRVTVPCGDGDLSIGDLADAALRRYRKATGKSDGSWVTVHNLKSLADGGILDKDDHVASVCDDKDQILAIYDEQEPAPSHLVSVAGEEVMEGRRTGTVSSDELDLVRIGSGRRNHRQTPLIVANSSTVTENGGAGASVENAVEVTSLDRPLPAGLSVLKNQPVIERCSRSDDDDVMGHNDDQMKEEATALDGGRTGSGIYKKKRQAPKVPPSVSGSQSMPLQTIHSVDASASPSAPVTPAENLPLFQSNGVGRFVRSSARQSVLADKWIEAAHRAEESSWQGASHDPIEQKEADMEPTCSSERDLITVSAHKPRDIQLVPEYETNGKLAYVIVKRIDFETMVENSLRAADRILEIRERPVYQMSFARAEIYAQETFEKADSNATFVVSREKTTTSGNRVESKGKVEASPAGKGQLSSALQQANVKKMGNKMTIELCKGSQGLGFTVTSRDTAVGERPFYIKTVLPFGAANDDGRLRAGDRLLEVNNQSLVGFSQNDVVNLLRQLKQGDVARLLIARHNQTSSAAIAKRSASVDSPIKNGLCPNSPRLPRPLPPEPNELRNAGGDGDSEAMVQIGGSSRIVASVAKQMLTLEVPLNNTGSAGLGVSVKGRTQMVNASSNLQEDCGIFIKAIMCGGAAHKDGRLRVNDQLVSINGVKLLGKSNDSAKRLIEKTMHAVGKSAPSIQISVMRAVPSVTTPMVANHAHMRADNDGASPDSMHLSPGGGSINSQPPSPTKATTRTTMMSVPGYGDYAVIMKNGVNSGEGSTIIIEDNKNTERIYSKPVNNIPRRPEDRAVTEIPLYEDVHEMESAGGDGTAFSREAPGRRSMSEKRRHGLSAKNDPSLTATYQRIKHQRQTSAPILQGTTGTTNPLSVSPSRHLTHQHNTEPRSKVRQAVHSREQSTPVTIRVNSSDHHDEPMKRRSLSLESLSKPTPPQHTTTAAATEMKQQRQSPMMIHELVVTEGGVTKKLPPAMKKVQRARPTNDSFRQAVDRSYADRKKEVGVDIGLGGAVGNPATASVPSSQSAHDQLNHSSLPRSDVNRDKQRRKSTGSGLFSKGWFNKLGSGRSKEASPENSDVEEIDPQTRARRAAEEEQRKIREQYEKLKRQQHDDIVKTSAALRHKSVSPPPHPRAMRTTPAVAATSAPLLPGTKRPASSQLNARRAGVPPPYPHAQLAYSVSPVRQPPPPYHEQPTVVAYPPRNYDEDAASVANRIASTAMAAPWFVSGYERSRFYRSLERSSPHSGFSSSGAEGRHRDAAVSQAPPRRLRRWPPPHPDYWSEATTTTSTSNNTAPRDLGTTNNTYSHHPLRQQPSSPTTTTTTTLNSSNILSNSRADSTPTGRQQSANSHPRLQTAFTTAEAPPTNRPRRRRSPHGAPPSPNFKQEENDVDDYRRYLRPHKQQQMLAKAQPAQRPASHLDHNGERVQLIYERHNSPVSITTVASTPTYQTTHVTSVHL